MPNRTAARLAHLLVTCLTVVGPLCSGSSPAAAQSGTFVWIATPDTLDGPYDGILDHPLLNGRPDAIPLLTPLWNPDRGPTGIYQDGELTVWYAPGAQRWGFESRSRTGGLEEIPLGTAFNVWVPRVTGQPASGAAFVHTASLANSAGNVTQLDHPLLNGNPFALLTVTKTIRTPEGLNWYPIGVAYDAGQERWVIYNENEAIMPILDSWPRFHVAVGTSGLGFDIARFTGERVDCDDPIVNYCNFSLADPSANGMIQRVYGGFYHPKTLGLWWNSMVGRWSFFTEDQSNLPAGVGLNAVMTTGIFESGFETGDTLGWSTSP